MNKALKLLLIALVVIILLPLLPLGVMIYSAFNTISKTDTEWDNYEMYRTKLHYAEEFLPTQNEFSNANAVHFSYQENFMLMFISDTVAVTVQYSPDDYLQTKESIMQTFDFLDAPLREQDEYYIASRTSNDYLLDDAFSHKGYNFRVVNYDGCKFFGMIGTNDSTNSIAYLYYSDTDRDYIAEEGEDLDQEMRELIDDEFHWNPFTE